MLLATLEGGYAARSRDGMPTLLIPLENIPSGAAGFRALGCELLGHPSVQVVESGQSRNIPAAALICTQPDLLDSFAVLAGDILRITAGSRTWRTIAAAVEEWLALLAPKGRPSVEREIGLWGELWFLARSVDVGRVLASWRGPEQDASDFFLDGKSVEVKTSRARNRHFVSQTQVDAPAGDRPAWLLSMWVKVDPSISARGVSDLVDLILERAPDRADALRRIARAGYSPGDRNAYGMRLVMLEEPGWFPAGKVPRVRAADPGVSNLRYQVSLIEDFRATPLEAKLLWVHFNQQPFHLDQ